ncbi:MAG TPA: hypothetical protein VF137_10450 [Candidatus Dormibacteraeota bacterium]
MAACDSGSGSPSSAVQQPGGPSGVLLPGPPAGFTGQLDTSLSVQAASAATPAQPAATAQALSSGGYGAGQERVWAKGSEYITAIGLQFSTDIDAANFVHFEVSQISASPAAVVTPLSAIPGATSFTLFGLTRKGSRQSFCQGVWFSVTRNAFELLDCADAPRYPDVVDKLAREQYSRATAQS